MWDNCRSLVARCSQLRAHNHLLVYIDKLSTFADISNHEFFEVSSKLQKTNQGSVRWETLTVLILSIKCLIQKAGKRWGTEEWIQKYYCLPTKPGNPLTMLTTEVAPYTINWKVITRTTNTPIKRTPTGHASNAMSPRKDMSEREEISMQKVGMRDDKEKKVYEPYTSRERYYEQQYQSGNLRLSLEGYTQWMSSGLPNYNGAKTIHHRLFQGHM